MSCISWFGRRCEEGWADYGASLLECDVAYGAFCLEDMLLVYT